MKTLVSGNGGSYPTRDSNEGRDCKVLRCQRKVELVDDKDCTSGMTSVGVKLVKEIYVKLVKSGDLTGFYESQCQKSVLDWVGCFDSTQGERELRPVLVREVRT